MKEKVASLETQMALMQSDINTIKNREPELPKWLKNSAVVILMAMFTQIMTSVWWASSITVNLNNIKEEVALNTDFRMEFPKLHQEVMVELEKIKGQNIAIENNIRDMKSKLKFVGKNGKDN